MLTKALIAALVPYIPDLVKAASEVLTEAYDNVFEGKDYNLIKEMSDDEIKQKEKK